MENKTETKKGNKEILRVIICSVILLFSIDVAGQSFYQIKIYHLESKDQEQRMDAYLSDAYIPAMHQLGIKHVGVFKPVEKDTTFHTTLYVLTPFKSVSQFEQLEQKLLGNKKYLEKGNDYIDSKHNDAPYKRIESILLRSFHSMPDYGVPTHNTPVSEQIYELRSYQGATEKLYRKKVEMFDQGESKLFIDLGFQPIFFGEVISGAEMPNLMYLTTFENEKAQAEHWKAFRVSPIWEALKTDPQYKNTVSHIDKYLLRPTEYSDL